MAATTSTAEMSSTMCIKAIICRRTRELNYAESPVGFTRIIFDSRILSGYIYSMTYTAFHGVRKVAVGEAVDLVKILKRKGQGEIIVFDDSTGEQTDLDLRRKPPQTSVAPIEPRGPGRPRLGVIAKEVTLLPRHWDWLNVQPGGAS